MIKFTWKLWSHYWAKKKKLMTEKHATKMFYITLDQAIEKCKTERRKFYLMKKSMVEWEILGSQEIKKLKKFKTVRKDEDFRSLEEKSVVVCPENLDRLTYEQSRRRHVNKWWNSFTGNYYQPVTKDELDLLKSIRENFYSYKKHYYDIFLPLDAFIKKHS
jgi:hypothetical protein